MFIKNKRKLNESDVKISKKKLKLLSNNNDSQKSSSSGFGIIKKSNKSILNVKKSKVLSQESIKSHINASPEIKSISKKKKSKQNAEKGTVHSKLSETDIDDPFALHFDRNLSKEQGEEIGDSSSWLNRFDNWPALGRMKIQWPELKVKGSQSRKLLLEEDEDSEIPTIGAVPHSPFPMGDFSKMCCISPQGSLQNATKSFTAQQREMLTLLSQYSDFYYPYATFEKWEKIRKVYSLHCVNHILKTNKAIVTHNQEVKRLKEADEDFDSPEFVDQGFTRPKVVILLPFKNSAYRVIKMIISLLGLQVMNLKRFEKDFGPPEPVDERNKKKNRPEDFLKTFEGDIKEDFKIGLTATPKCLKLYSEFFQADIIVASPLGLRYVIDTAKNPTEVAFLSSIELLVLDQADVFLMQNWEHVLIILESLNKYPKNLQELGFDLYRVRRWCLEGLSAQYRQTVVLSATNSDLVRSFFGKTNNFAGKVQVLHLLSSGSLSKVSVRAELTLQKVRIPSSAECYSPDGQFDFFTKDLLPRIRGRDQSHTLIYVPDYCDYIRLVRFFKDDGGTNVSTINEYMVGDDSKIAKAKSLFFVGRRKFLIYTERFHFYKRTEIKGVQHVVFYGLPTYPHFFPEICNFLRDELQNPREPPPVGLKTITVPFQRFDTAKMVDLLGATKASEILNSDKAIHVTVVGGC